MFIKRFLSAKDAERNKIQLSLVDSVSQKRKREKNVKTPWLVWLSGLNASL